MKTVKSLALLTILLLVNHSVFADFKISQKTTIEEISTELTVYAKGVRERREQKTVIEGDDNDDPEVSAMMANMMPGFTTITQCDLKQDVTLSEKNRSYFVDYYDWSELPPDQLKRRSNQKMVIKGTATVSSTVTDSGKRQQMFGLTARWQKSVMSLETSADSCDGRSNVRLEQEGWFVDLVLAKDSCQVPQIKASSGGCRPKMIMKSMQSPGFFLEGTTKSFTNNTLDMTVKLQTTALSKATLDQALFEIPKNYTEVDSMSELMQSFGPMPDTSAKTQITEGKTVKNLKTVAIDFFSGNASKVNQTELRDHISAKLTAAGLSGFPINSQADLLTGNFSNVISVELKKVKESGASKIGGLFGKVTGTDDGAKLGESEAEIVITIFGKDGKTVVATATAVEKVKGKGNDAVKAAIDKIINGLLDKIR